MTPDELREILALLGWSQEKAARKLGRSYSRVRKMARGRHPIDDDTAVWLRKAARAEMREMAGEELTEAERSALGELLG